MPNEFPEKTRGHLRRNSIKVFQFGIHCTTKLVLNKVRNQIKPFVDTIGRGFAKTGISPNVLTIIGFLFALLAAVLYATRPSQPYLAALAIIVSGIFDVIDGAVARITNKVTKSGSFNDSTLDRLAEVAIYSGIIYAGYTDSLAVLLALGFSLLVSYTRAKGDSLFVTLTGVGIGERAERLLALVFFSLIGFVWIGVYLVLALAVITFVQRYFTIMSKLSVNSEKSAN